MPGRSCIDDDHGFGVLLRELADPHPGHQLVDARQRQLEKSPQLLFVQIRPAIAELEKLREVFVEKLRIQLLRAQCFDQKVVGLSGGRIVEEIAEIGRRIGGEEDCLTSLAVVERRRRGDRRFADAAFAAEEENAAIRERIESLREGIHPSSLRPHPFP